MKGPLTPPFPDMPSNDPKLPDTAPEPKEERNIPPDALKALIALLCLKLTNRLTLAEYKTAVISLSKDYDLPLA